jgi:NTP pyrophosphatase (non-canonical NTP hydrolase)
MQFGEYQEAAKQTDQMPFAESEIRALMLPLLGLAGETGSLLTHFKRFFRDGEGYEFFRQRIAEELGDILWNVSNIATKANLELEDIAQGNLVKIRDRWLDVASQGGGSKPFDESYPTQERFPRQFEIEVTAERDQAGRSRALLSRNGSPFGSELSDNSDRDDGYRHHDVFHLAFLANLGWSPVLRGKQFFNCKRRSDPNVDEVQDGGRASVIDEAISALIFAEAKKNWFYEKVDTVEYGILRTIKELTAHLEVSRCTGRQWERAILDGFRVWRDVRRYGGGRILGDLDTRKIEFQQT